MQPRSDPRGAANARGSWPYLPTQEAFGRQQFTSPLGRPGTSPWRESEVPLSVKVTNWVWEHSRSRNAARLLLLSIADHAHGEGHHAWPSIKRLMQMTGLAERTVQAAIAELVELEELVVEHNAGPGHCNLYRILMTPADPAPPQNLHPAESAPPQEVHPTPADPAPEPPQNLHPEPLREPSENQQRSIPSASQPGVVTIRPDVDRLCELLADGVQATTGERPKINKRGWTDPARLLIDRDGYTAEQVEALIRWSQDHDFWRSHILSMSKLRDKRLTLIAQIRRDTATKRRDEPALWAGLREL